MVIIEKIKKSLGLPQGDDSFDDQIKTYIDISISDILSETSFEDDWTNMIKMFIDGEEVPSEYKNIFDTISSFIFIKVKLLFDPPQPSLVQIYSEQSNKFLWRIKEDFNLIRK